MKGTLKDGKKDDGTHATFEKFAKKIKPLYSLTSYMYIIRSHETRTLKKTFLSESLKEKLTACTQLFTNFVDDNFCP